MHISPAPIEESAGKPASQVTAMRQHEVVLHPDDKMMLSLLPLSMHLIWDSPPVAFGSDHRLAIYDKHCCFKPESQIDVTM